MYKSSHTFCYREKGLNGILQTEDCLFPGKAIVFFFFWGGVVVTECFCFWKKRPVLQPNWSSLKIETVPVLFHTHPFIHPYFHPSRHPSLLYPFLHLFIHLSFPPFIHLYCYSTIHLFIHSSILPPSLPSTHLFHHPPIYLLIHPIIPSFIHPSIYTSTQPSTFHSCLH